MATFQELLEEERLLEGAFPGIPRRVRMAAILGAAMHHRTSVRNSREQAIHALRLSSDARPVPDWLAQMTAFLSLLDRF